MNIKRYLQRAQQNLATFMAGEGFTGLTPDMQADFRSQASNLQTALNGAGEADENQDSTLVLEVLMQSQSANQSLMGQLNALRTQMASMLTPEQASAQIEDQIKEGKLFRKDGHEALMQSAVDAAREAAEQEAEAKFKTEMANKAKATERRQMLTQSALPAPETESVLESSDTDWTQSLATAKTRFTDLTGKGMKKDAKALSMLLWSDAEIYDRLAPQFLDAIQFGKGATFRTNPPAVDPLVVTEGGAGTGVLAHRSF